MTANNATTEDYEEIRIFGKPALFTCLRLDRDTVPKGLYRYEVRHDDDNQGEPVELARGIFVNHWGTILTREPLLSTDDRYRLIDAQTQWEYSAGKCRTVGEFMRSYPPQQKQGKAQAR